MTGIDGVDLVTVHEAAKIAGRTPETVRRWVWSGRLTARRDGNRLLVARDDVARLIGRGPRSDGAGDPLSLVDWRNRVRATLDAGLRGSSAAALVLADRAEREETRAGR